MDSSTPSSAGLPSNQATVPGATQDPPMPAAGNISPSFSAPDADLILRSSDAVTFKVFRQILSQASVVFADMFVVGRDERPATQGTPLDLPTVELAEDSAVLTDLLRFIYPVPNPTIHSLDYCSLLISAAEKYMLEAATHALRQALTSPPFLAQSPIRVYAIACSHGFTPEAKLASKHTLNFEVLKTDIYEEFSRVTARDLLKLIQLHRIRGETAVEILDSAGPAACGGCGLLSLPTWFVEWKRRARDELLCRPTTGTVFKPEYLASCVTSIRHCSQCALSYISPGTQARLLSFQQRIETLPDEIS